MSAHNKQKRRLFFFKCSIKWNSSKTLESLVNQYEVGKESDLFGQVHAHISFVAMEKQNTGRRSLEKYKQKMQKRSQLQDEMKFPIDKKERSVAPVETIETRQSTLRSITSKRKEKGMVAPPFGGDKFSCWKS